VLSLPAVSARITGATRVQHLHDAIAAIEVELTADEVTRSSRRRCRADPRHP
jgi:1-deoxyxylulose-5-phosphate synthase